MNREAGTMVGQFIQEVINPARLAALRRLGLLDTPAEEAFDRLGALAATALKSPVALVTLVDDTRQFFKSCRGLPEPWATWRDTPLSHSFCQHVLASNKPLIISDSREDPVFAENLAIRDLGVIGYLGIPLVLNTGEVIGSFCVIDHQPRLWTDAEVEILSSIAASVMTEIELRSEVRAKKVSLEEVGRLNAQLSEKAAQLEAAREDLEAFNRSLFHDLRSPVATVSAFAQLLRESGAASMNRESLEYLNRVSDGAMRIERILDGLTTLFGTLQRPLQREAVDLTDIAEKVLRALQASSPERKVSIRVQPGMKVDADCHLAQVALENLLHNAWKFTGKTEDAGIEFGENVRDEGRVFFIRDNGAGFDSIKATRLFLPFERFHSKREFAGTGLGLSTVKRIIESHGGRIWVESEAGQGATFYFTFGEGRPQAASGAVSAAANSR